MRLRNAGSARCRDRLEQLERKRERERKLREQQKEQREQKERERRAEERRKEREARREGARAGGGLALSRSRGECWCLGRSRHPGAEPRPGSGLLGGGGRQAGRAGSGRGQWLVWGVRRSCPQGVAQGHLRPSAGPLLRVPCAGCPLAPGHLPAEAVLGLPFLTNGAVWVPGPLPASGLELLFLGFLVSALGAVSNCVSCGCACPVTRAVAISMGAGAR